MQLYNVLSCKGFIEANEKITMSFGSCAKARLAIVILFFINAFVRKWFGEEMGNDYNFWMGFVGGFIGFLIPISITGNVGISFVIGLAGMLILGFGSGAIFGGDEGYGFE